MKKIHWISLVLISIVALVACKKDEETIEATGPTPYVLVIPDGLPNMNIPSHNPLTVEGVALGKKLFYDEILSGNNTQSCGDCHQAAHSFTDPLQFSIGIDGIAGTRNGMPITNLGWQPGFFWDGGATDLESQVIGPIQNPVEMHETLVNCIAELNAHPDYPSLFKAAFGIDEITTPFLMRAVAQFERTLISGNSRYDQYVRGDIVLSALELEGMNLFTDMSKGDCNHCHVLGSTFSDFGYRNTGLDSIPVDEGRYLITLFESDKGRFKTPSLRNIEVSGPYMHDGRFSTLMQCIEHYNTGFHYSANLDGNLATSVKGRMNLEEMQAIEAFLLTLTDTEFLNNPAFQPE
ncbi:MAG: cytochrome c peroxidase [Flavobacteriales bacterium]|nr:cytochrome c peroxidase [Flavobacteriales bacterium]